MPPTAGQCRFEHRIRAALLCLVWFAFYPICPPVLGQLVPYTSDSQVELSNGIGLNQADSHVATELERAKAFATDGQWDQAVAVLRRVMEQSGEQLWPVAPRRFITVRDYCQLQLAALPEPALKVYRAQVDPLARRWYDQAIREHNPAPLRKIAREALASRYGDDALLALGEIALDRGHAATARAWWERILPIEHPPKTPHGWLAFPDTDIDLAAIRARLILASILEGSRQRAANELAQFEKLHPGAKGKMAGREVEFAVALRELLADSASWPVERANGNWPTFAGAPARTHVAPNDVDPDGVTWRFSLKKTHSHKTPDAASYLGLKISDVWSTAGPSFHPIRVGPLVLVNNSQRIWALKLSSGKAAWGNSPVVFDHGPAQSTTWPGGLIGTVGRAQHTMTVKDGKLYARMGHPWTGPPRHTQEALEKSYLVCIDLAGEGRLLWKVFPEAGPWAFEGSPLCDGQNVYVALRRGDIRAQAHVACYDARTGRQRWRRFICTATTPGQNLYPEITHNLLTLGEGTLYYNTNLGAVAALSRDNGHVQWVSLYPRRRQLDLAKLDAHWGRSLNPCIYHKGKILVAPSDSRRIFALDAMTGQILWQSGSQVENVVHLLGVAGDRLIATGRRVYWIDVGGNNQGKIRHAWPRGEFPQMQGRGILAGESVYIPADDRVYVLDQGSANLKKIIELRPKDALGGNLLIADDQLLIATKGDLISLGRIGPKKNTQRKDVVLNTGYHEHPLAGSPGP